MASSSTCKIVTQEQYDEAVSELVDALADNRRLIEESRYLVDFIHQKGLDAEFAVFMKSAHEDTDSNLPFPRLIADIQRKES